MLLYPTGCVAGVHYGTTLVFAQCATHSWVGPVTGYGEVLDRVDHHAHLQLHLSRVRRAQRRQRVLVWLYRALDAAGTTSPTYHHHPTQENPS